MFDGVSGAINLIFVSFALMGVVIIVLMFWNSSIVADECKSDCSKIGLDVFRFNISGGLFGGSKSSCSCVNKDSNVVQVVW